MNYSNLSTFLVVSFAFLAFALTSLKTVMVRIELNTLEVRSYAKENEKAQNGMVENEMVENGKVENETVENETVENETVEEDVSVFDMKKLSQRINKRFVYMITSCKWDAQDKRLVDSEHRDVIVLTFCEEFKSVNVQSIYGPNTTWNEARNILLDAALSGNKSQG